VIVNKLIHALLLAIAVLAVLAAAAPTLGRLAGALVPCIVAAGIVIALLRIVWFYTR
jgi:hypothetical protein